MRRRVPRGLWVGLSIAGHAGVLAILATAQPQLRQVESPPVFEVTVAPRFLTTAEDRHVPRETAANRPLRPRRALRPDETSEVAPMITRNAPASTLRGDTVAPSVAPESGPTAEASPDLLRNAWHVPFYFGGTSLLIVVVVVMDFTAQIQAHLVSHQYESLLKKANLKGR